MNTKKHIPKRENLEDHFSQFLDWGDSPSLSWKSDSRLLLRVRKHIQDDISKHHNYWAIYFHRRWIQAHEEERKKKDYYDFLYAYLQDPCGWAVINLCKRRYHKFFNYKDSDLFCIGNSLVEKVLSEFNSRRDTSLWSFAKYRFNWRIIDKLREENKKTGSTEWGLLRHSSKASLCNALIKEGFSQEEKDNYLLAWNCYNEIYTESRKKTNGKLEKPSDKILQEIADQYNRETKSSIKTNAQTIERWLIFCAQALRVYHKPKIISMNAPVREGENGTLEDFIEDLPANSNLIETLEQVEKMQLHWNSVKEAMQRLTPKRQNELQMYYGDERKQEEIDNQAGNAGHSSASRRLKTARRHLLEQLIPLLQNQWPDCLQNIDIETIIQSNTFKEWLKDYYEYNNQETLIQED